ncbi:MAG TPA: asparagine synthase (glutamine-hydrolyzing) [Gaiella sp.]|jgi:asparagine synthase (glutamine-hydrolysing)
MCGICGAIQLSGRPRRLLGDGALERMSEAMVHRGPDDAGTFAAPGIALSARRLSIVDVAGGHQPVSNEDGSIWAVQNGELFNHRDVRRELSARRHMCKSNCDTEVIPHLYEEHGADFADHLRGMFAIALWDERARRGVLVRDRLGIKPLYYAVAGDQVLFASELKCLLASGEVGEELDYEAIDAYLTLGFFPYPATPLLSVRKLPPGHRIVVEDGEMRVEEWWRYPEPAPIHGRSEADWRDRVIAKLRESVELRLMSDVPLGAMLSGGLDSSLIVALMSELATEPVKTFSVGFSGMGVHNELADARKVADLYGTDHHELRLSTDEPVLDLPALVWHLDEPLADLSSLGFIALCELARRDVTVALSGQGADELLGGYRRHRSAAFAARWEWVPGPVRRVAGASAGIAPQRLRRGLRVVGAPDPASRQLALTAKMGASLHGSLVTRRLAQLDGRAAWRAVERHVPPGADALAATLVLDARLGLVDDMLHYFDRASMAHSLEVRVPFLDHELVELCATVPTSLKVKDGVTKYLLKEAARGRVPDELIDKPKVGFFNAAVDRWFSTQAGRDAAEVLLDPGARYASLLDRNAVASLLDRHRRDARSTAGHALLAVVMLELWLSTFLPRARAASRAPVTASAAASL